MAQGIVFILLLFIFSFVVAQDSSSCQGEDCAEERDVDSGFHSNSMVTICLPDSEGKVGSIDGESFVLLYGFGMETLAGSSIDDILYSVKTSLQMFLIEEYLPEECSSFPMGRRLQENGVKGFDFDEELDAVAVECEPRSSPDADCGLFEGVIHVFGSGDGVQRKVDEFFIAADPQALHIRLLRIFPSGNSEAASTLGSGTKTISSTENGVAAGGFVGIALWIALAALLVGMTGLVYFQRKRRSSDSDSATVQEYLGHGEGLIFVDVQSTATKPELPDID